MTKYAMVVGIVGVLLAAVIVAVVVKQGDGESNGPEATPPRSAAATVIPASRTASAATSVPTSSALNGAASLDPCAFVTRSEAEAAFGLAAQEPAAKGAVCHYDTVEKTKFFDLTVRKGTSKDFENSKNLCGSGTEPVPGLGGNSCSTNNTVVVLTRDVLIYIIAGGNFDQDNLKALAETAAARVP